MQKGQTFLARNTRGRNFLKKNKIIAQAGLKKNIEKSDRAAIARSPKKAIIAIKRRFLQKMGDFLEIKKYFWRRRKK